MGITTTTTIICDLCGDECGEYDSYIDFAINDGDGRDVGPTRIKGRITLYAPYRVEKGLLCNECLIINLKRFIKQQETE